ncbi:hypothetical protein ACP26L_36105 (plasmid) [Paenibacillus sp. S-38]|uniref:hypothetical protein n=1 Tax=Paenibacillus sp. S-38 TaxID=3416710 RepID=UPI003CE81869
MNRQEIEAGAQELVVRRKAMNRLASAGLPTPPKPEDSVEGRNLFTEWDNLKKRHGGVANIPFTELGDFLDRWTAMIAYARWCESVADLDRTTALEIRNTIQDQLYPLQEGNRELRAATVATEELYRHWQEQYLEANAIYTAMKGLREGYEQRANAISREITRRGADVMDARRGMNRGVLA